jgi:serine/threonine protein kinase
MDFIHGSSAVDALSTSAEPDAMWIQILAQVALVMGYLEEKIYLDHRDLKADNLWIHPVPVEYTLTVGEIPWKIKAPFQVVILDFGFACLGNGRGNAVVSLSDGILPKIDPCPKEGRDLFQLITSMWSIPSIRARASTDVKEAMESLLKFKNTSYIHITNQTIQTHWIYLAVSDNRFKHPPLHPVTLLLKLSSDWADVGLYRE